MYSFILISNRLADFDGSRYKLLANSITPVWTHVIARKWENLLTILGNLADF